MRLTDLENRDLPAESFTWLQARLQNRWYPRDLSAAVGYLQQVLAGRSFYFYGAGTHTKALLERLQGNPLLDGLQGILDRQPQPGQSLVGVKVYPASKALEDREPLLVLSHAEFEDNMADDLRALGVAAERILPIYQAAEYGALAEGRLAGELKELIAAVPAAGAKQRILFISARNRRILDQRVVAELKEDFQCISINMERVDQDFSAAAYDINLPAFNSLSVCLQYIDALGPDLVYVQEHYSSGNFLPIIPKLFFPEQRVVGEFYDFLGLIFDDPYVLARESYWREEDVRLGIDAENWAINHLDGIVTKESGPLLTGFLGEATYLQLQPHLKKAEFATHNNRLHQPLRLVWAGSIAPSHLSTAIIGNNQLLDVFQELVELGFSVTAFTNCPDWEVLNSQYADYLQLAKQKNFHIQPAIPQQQLIERLASEFDYGIALGKLKPGHQQGLSNRVTVSGKIFTYVAAGLPMLVADYYEAMGAWVEKYGLGLLVDPDWLQGLPERLHKQDYEKLIQNIYAYREKHNFDANVPVLVDFFREIINTQERIT